MADWYGPAYHPQRSILAGSRMEMAKSRNRSAENSLSAPRLSFHPFATEGGTQVNDRRI
jgi:hypothetical protein